MIEDKYVKSDWQEGEVKYMRDGFGRGLVEVGQDERVVAVTADLGESLRMEEFGKQYPDRYLNVGVAEQNMVGVAAGLASEGMIPFGGSFGVFSPGRSWDQIRVSVAYSQANVKLVGSHGGVATGEDGATHQALEDVAMMRTLPGMVVVAPCDYTQARMAVKAIKAYQGPVYLRLVRPKTVDFTKEVPFEIGKAYVYRKGQAVTVLAYGLQVWEGLRAAEELAQEGIEVEVINVSTIKPLDEETILESIKKTGRVVVAEDHQMQGGLGEAVAGLVVGKGMRVAWGQVGLEDRFGESGSWRELYKKYGLDWRGIREKIRAVVKNGGQQN